MNVKEVLKLREEKKLEFEENRKREIKEELERIDKEILKELDKNPYSKFVEVEIKVPKVLDELKQLGFFVEHNRSSDEVSRSAGVYWIYWEHQFVKVV